MYHVALIQNQSEMAHYGYADAQNLLLELGYSPTLYTAHNIQSLAAPTAEKKYDTIIIASNAMNDRKIRSELSSPTLATAIESYLSDGGGLLCLHQLGLASASEGRRLPFLPENLRKVSLQRRPPQERADKGAISIPQAGQQHVIALYPNQVTSESLRRISLGFQSLPGLYWHYWTHADLVDWDTLVIDDSTAPQRPLIISSKETDVCRVVLSALPLDWQRQRYLLENVLTYVVEGRHSNALIADDATSTAEFSYLVDVLRSRRLPFRVYGVSVNQDQLARNIFNQVHSTLLLASESVLGRLEQNLQQIIWTSVEKAKLRLLTLGQLGESEGQLTVRNRRPFAVSLLRRLQIQVQAELLSGYIDGSLWSTAEALRSLSRINELQLADAANFSSLIGKVLEQISDHDRDGSYDETFGATCAALSVRVRYLGPTDESVKASMAWLRARIDRFEGRERALFYETLAESNCLSDAERVQLVNLLDSLRIDQLTQTDAISFLRAAASINHVNVMPALIAALAQNAHKQDWSDTATAAGAASILIESEDQLRAASGHVVRMETFEQSRRLKTEAITEIQDIVYRAAKSDTPYPWDGKASTSAICLEAWLRFDSQLVTPVYDAVEALTEGNSFSALEASDRTAMSALEQLKEQNQDLQARVINYEHQVTVIRSHRRRISRTIVLFRILAGIAVFALYIASVLIVVAVTDGTKARASLLSDSFVSPWTFHLTIASVIVASLAVPWGRLLAWSKERE
ncbi:MAG: hypothetical protein ACRDSZ_23900 [Pseudonocardiaceae bacterium]